MAIRTLELDLQHVQRGHFKIKELYIEKIEEMISKAIQERKHLKSTMYRDKIQVNLLTREESFTTYQYILGGNEMEVPFNNMVIRKNVELILRELWP